MAGMSPTRPPEILEPEEVLVATRARTTGAAGATSTIVRANAIEESGSPSASRGDISSSPGCARASSSSRLPAMQRRIGLVERTERRPTGEMYEISVEKHLRGGRAAIRDCSASGREHNRRSRVFGMTCISQPQAPTRWSVFDESRLMEESRLFPIYPATAR